MDRPEEAGREKRGEQGEDDREVDERGVKRIRQHGGLL
jgi:hypothetical protein